MTEVEAIGQDIMRGVKTISGFINDTPRNTYHKLEKKLIPGGKEGNTWIASKRALREHYRKLTGNTEAA